MPDPTAVLLFAAASALLIAVPGPSVVYIVARSIEQGRRAGLVSMLGVQTGACVHVAAAALGVSAIIASSAAAFSVVKYAGAGYLVYLGVQKLRHAGEAVDTDLSSRHHLFRQGVVVNVLNPKTAIFFLAFLPQFVDPDAGAVAPQVLVLGMIFVAIALISDGLYALAAGTLADRLRRSAAIRRRLDRASGGIMIGLGAVAALTGERAK